MDSRIGGTLKQTRLDGNMVTPNNFGTILSNKRFLENFILLLVAIIVDIPLALIIAEILVIILLAHIRSSIEEAAEDEVPCMSWKQCALRAFHGRYSVRIIDGDAIGEDPEV